MDIKPIVAIRKRGIPCVVDRFAGTHQVQVLGGGGPVDYDVLVARYGDCASKTAITLGLTLRL